MIDKNPFLCECDGAEAHNKQIGDDTCSIFFLFAFSFSYILFHLPAPLRFLVGSRVFCTTNDNKKNIIEKWWNNQLLLPD